MQRPRLSATVDIMRGGSAHPHSEDTGFGTRGKHSWIAVGQRKAVVSLLSVALFLALVPQGVLATDLVSQVRIGLGVTPSDADDRELQQFLKDSRNKRFIQGILKQSQFGSSVDSFLSGRPSDDISRIAKKMLKDVTTKPMMEALSWFIKQGSATLQFLGQIRSLLSTISSGLEVYSAFCDVLSRLELRVVFDEYFAVRVGVSPEEAFRSMCADTVYSYAIEKVIRFRRPLTRATAPISEQEKRQFATYLEYCYQAWKLATDSDRKAAIKQSVLDRIPRTSTVVKPSPPAPAPGPSTVSTTSTAAALVIDVSGSMGDTWNGGIKIESAKQAAVDFIDLVRQEKEATGADHRIAVVGFTAGASIFLPMTNDYEQARRVVISLGPRSSTNLGAGIETGLSELRKVAGTAQRFIVLLSDGMTNAGLSEEQILAGPVAEARQQRICINTVGFGNPGGINDKLLTEIAQASGCGNYYYAASGLQLFGTFARIRHQALGQVMPSLSSFDKQVTVLPGTSIALGTFFLPGNQEELYVTLGWSGGGGLRLRLQDPEGRELTSTYPGVHLYTATRFSHVIVIAPKSGFWKVEAEPLSLSPSQIEYFSISSTRPGGAAFSLPLPVITVWDRTFALPAGLPTPVLVLVSLAAIALAIWKALNL